MKTIYRLHPGIAAACDLIGSDGTVQTWIYLSGEKQPVTTDQVPRRDTPLDQSGLPLQVRAAINKHFGTVFALPLERRGEYLANLVTETIEVEQ